MGKNGFCLPNVLIELKKLKTSAVCRLNGFSLIEGAIVLGIVGLVIGGIWGYRLYIKLATISGSRSWTTKKVGYILVLISNKLTKKLVEPLC